MIAGCWFNYSLWSRASRVTEGLHHLLYDPTDSNYITHGAKCQRRHSFERKLNEGCQKYTRGVGGSKNLSSSSKNQTAFQTVRTIQCHGARRESHRYPQYHDLQMGSAKLQKQKCTLYIYAALSLALIWQSDWLGWVFSPISLNQA